MKYVLENITSDLLKYSQSFSFLNKDWRGTYIIRKKKEKKIPIKN